MLELVNGSMKMLNASFPSLSVSALENTNGDLNITGAFSRYPLASSCELRTAANQVDSPHFPSLAYVGCNLFLRSSNSIDCAPFRQLYVNGSIKGSFSCTGLQSLRQALLP